MLLTGRQYFNPHSHSGSDGQHRGLFLADGQISIHRPTQGVTWQSFLGHTPFPKFQSTLPLREWLYFCKNRIWIWRISIHTPTQGVTQGFWRICLHLWFQSTLPLREWLFYVLSCFIHGIFQSTLPLREWHLDGILILHALVISIHTPTQGVTFCFRYSPHTALISIHTPTQGVTADSCDIPNCLTISIHTPTQGVTGITAVKTAADYISIHTPTQGVTKI